MKKRNLKKANPKPTGPQCEDCLDILGQAKTCRTCIEYRKQQAGEAMPDATAAQLADAAPGSVKDPRAVQIVTSKTPVALHCDYCAGSIKKGETATHNAITDRVYHQGCAEEVVLGGAMGAQPTLAQVEQGAVESPASGYPLSTVPVAADGATTSFFIGECVRCHNGIARGRELWVDDGPTGESQMIVHDSCSRQEDTINGRSMHLRAPTPEADPPSEQSLEVEREVRTAIKRIAHNSLPEIAQENLRLLKIAAEPIMRIDVLGLSIDDVPAALAKAAESIKAMRDHLKMADAAVTLAPALEKHLLGQVSPDDPQLKLPLDSGAAGEPVGLFSDTGNELKCELSFEQGLAPGCEPDGGRADAHEDAPRVLGVGHPRGRGDGNRRGEG